MICYTNAPEAYDYEATVTESATVAGCFAERLGQRQGHPFRRVTLIDADEGYYADYQIGRYQSGGYLAVDPERWASWIEAGFIVDASESADVPLS